MKIKRPQSGFLHSLPETGSQSGFTLIEVLVALTIFSIGLLAIASMQITAIRTNSKAMYISEGTSWAEDRIEWLMTLNFSDVILAATDYKAVPGTPPPGYTVEYKVTDGIPRANCKAITVRTTWTDRGASRTSIIRAVKPQL